MSKQLTIPNFPARIPGAFELAFKQEMSDLHASFRRNINEYEDLVGHKAIPTKLFDSHLQCDQHQGDYDLVCHRDLGHQGEHLDSVEGIRWLRVR